MVSHVRFSQILINVNFFPTFQNKRILFFFFFLKVHVCFFKPHWSMTFFVILVGDQRGGASQAEAQISQLLVWVQATKTLDPTFPKMHLDSVYSLDPPCLISAHLSNSNFMSKPNKIALCYDIIIFSLVKARPEPQKTLYNII